MKCENCGTENKEGVVFCSECGKALVDAPIALDLDQLKIPAAARKQRIVKVNATKKSGSDVPSGEDAPKPEATPAEETPANREVPVEDGLIDLNGNPVESVSAPAAAEETEEKEASLDATQAPMKMGQWFGVFVLSLIPVVNLIMLLVWAISSSTNKSKQSYARAALIWSVILAVLAAAGVAVYAAFFNKNLMSMLPF